MESEVLPLSNCLVSKKRTKEEKRSAAQSFDASFLSFILLYFTPSLLFPLRRSLLAAIVRQKKHLSLFSKRILYSCLRLPHMNALVYSTSVWSATLIIGTLEQ